MPSDSIRSAVDRALAAYGGLSELGESDRRRVVVRQRPGRCLARAPGNGRRRARRRAARQRGPGGDRSGDRGDRPDRGPAPRDRLAVHIPAGRADRAGRGTVRFQDAARDARAVVYAGIQADPLVARVAVLLADATLEQRILARAVMNGETTDPAAWRATFPSAVRFGRRRRRRSGSIGGDPRGFAGGRRSRRAGAQPGPRRIRRGADGAAPRAPGGGERRSAASGGSCSTAFPRRSTRTT